ncbi:hypothetical protein LEMLEM_LOCUS172 [Lemmus lemmus]
MEEDDLELLILRLPPPDACVAGLCFRSIGCNSGLCACYASSLLGEPHP